MFYTKYRPQKFSEISKPNDAAEALVNQVKADKVSHAYLFIGPRGTGKTTTARILAKSLNCSSVSNGDPCGTCEVCEAIKIGNFLDLIEIDAASNRGIDDIRELKDKINLAPSMGKKKVYIIDEVHMLTKEAFNALLKTLEEPPAHTTFILCTTEEHKVPDTIKSRCQVFKFKRASVSQIVVKLQAILDSEKVKADISKGDLEKIAKASHGGFRDAETLLQQIVEGELDVESFVGVSDKQLYIDFVDSLIKKDSQSALRQVNSLYEDGVDLSTWATEFLKYLRDLLFIISNAHEGVVEVSDELFSEMEEQASKISSAKMVEFLEEFSLAQVRVKSSAIPQLPLEVAVLKVCGDKVGEDLNKTSQQKPSPNLEKDHPKEGKIATKTVKKATEINAKLEEVVDAWEDVLKGTVKHNHGVQALLKAAKPVKLNGNDLTIEVFYKFHKERLESSKNKRIVETVLEEIFGDPLILNCELSSEKPEKKSKNESGELTDMNVELPSDVSVGKSLLDVFDGALPM